MCPCVSYLGLKGALQRAEGPGRRDDGGKARHGRWVGVEELRKESGRGGVRTVRSVSEMHGHGQQLHQAVEMEQKGYCDG